jgi:F-type H+-transporting ATPase subunit epsilon
MFDNNKIIKFEIVTPERIVLKKNIHKVTLPTESGEITVLPKHEPLISILVPGVLELLDENDEKEIISISGGFIEVLRNKVVILADSAERAEEIDLERAEEARKRAREEIKNIRHEDRERFAEISGSMAKELARTKAVKRWKKIYNK